MKLVCVTPAYNEDSLIGACIKCFAPYVEKHIVLVSQKPYFGETDKMDKTADIARDLGAEVILGTWSMDHLQRNTAIQNISGCDWVITVDADMYIEKKDMERFIKKLENEKNDAVKVNHYPYWKDWEHVIEDTFKPVFAVRPQVRFVHIGNVSCETSFYEDIYLHHLSWSFPKDVRKKVRSYSHAPQISSDWYDNEYVKWEESDTANLPDRTYPIRKQRLPKEVMEFFI